MPALNVTAIHKPISPQKISFTLPKALIGQPLDHKKKNSRAARVEKINSLLLLAGEAPQARRCCLKGQEGSGMSDHAR
jgi:hypothetical protein